MKSKYSNSLLNQIDTTIIDIKSFQNISPNEMSYLAEFLVVYICGIYEEIIESAVNEMVDRLNKSEVTKFIEKTMHSSFRNPNMSNVIKLFSKFGNQVWIDTLKKMDRSGQTALDSIVENKNALGHGQSSHTLTLSDVENYYRSSRIIIEKIDDLLL